MRKHQGGDVRALDLQTLSTTATCFQCDGDGRRAGLKIRWGNTRVGSSPTFGTIYLGRIATCRFAPRGNKVGNGVAVTLEPQRWLEFRSAAEATAFSSATTASDAVRTSAQSPRTKRSPNPTR